MAKETIPAISVVIPMYNAEKYIGECLDSVLAQTFTDFEIIVVDDCSTDNSTGVVENYLKRGGEARLELIKLKVNSGGAGTPRNTGLKIARGKYIMFVDSDDIITKTALEELYPVAEKFNADVVSCEKWYETPMNGDISDKNSLKIFCPPTIKPVEMPTIIDSDISKRIAELNQRQFIWSTCMKLIRRDFVFENNLEILDICGEDAVFNCCLVCANAKYVRVPNIIYTYRIRENSFYHNEKNFSYTINRWGSSIIQGFNYLDNFLDKQDFFRQNPELKYRALEVIVSEFNNYLIRIQLKISDFQFKVLIRSVFEKNKCSASFITFIFSRMNVFNVNLIQQQNFIRQQQAQIQQLQFKMQQAAEYFGTQQK